MTGRNAHEGHMPIPGAANRDGGIFFAMGAINIVELAADGNPFTLGRGTLGQMFTTTLPITDYIVLEVVLASSVFRACCSAGK
ncbi:hypothetical protein EV426DRAFT_628710 [Tirmania nivea]|nr:hypothetical protein EV426DRAFT_628710 [Tirmania nivea]